ncbi:MAG: hypothetical protein OSB09_03315 [Planctomycetota bacterium]|nr:hypothetical protein [Planctomycetota bacterium]
MLQVTRGAILILIFCAASICVAAQSPPAGPAAAAAGSIGSSLRIEPLSLKTAKGSALPNLTNTADGSALLSWVEPAADGKGACLRLSTLGESGWGEAVTAAQGSGWFVNWADFPSAAVLPDGTMAVHWLDRISQKTYAYGVKVSISRDQGKTWSDPIIPHRDDSQTEHGFVALRSMGDRFFLAWLDGRAMADGEGKPMTLRATTISADGTRGIDRLLDHRVCDCCPLDALIDGEDVYLVYRDRDFLGVRDISWLQVGDKEIHQQGLVREDGWVQEGCPVNGPSIATSGGTQAVAWYTGVDRVLDQPAPEGAVLVSILEPDIEVEKRIAVRIDDGRPVGRVDIAGLGDGSYLICWLERQGDGGEVRVRRWKPGSATGSSHLIGSTSPGRRSGYPRIVSVTGGSAVVAWTETEVDGGTAVRTVKIPATPSSTPSSTTTPETN